MNLGPYRSPHKPQMWLSCVCICHDRSPQPRPKVEDSHRYYCEVCLNEMYRPWTEVLKSLV